MDALSSDLCSVDPLQDSGHGEAVEVKPVVDMLHQISADEDITKEEIRNQLISFLASDEDSMDWGHVDGQCRKLVHDEADKLNLLHISSGPKSKRTLTIRRKEPLPKKSTRLAATTAPEHTVEEFFDVPDAPPFLTAQNRSPSSLTWTWHAAQDNNRRILKYVLQQTAWSNDKQGMAWKDIYEGPNLTYTVSNLQPAARHLARVCACNVEGAGAWSQLAMGTTEPQALADGERMGLSLYTWGLAADGRTGHTLGSNIESEADSVIKIPTKLSLADEMWPSDVSCGDLHTLVTVCSGDVLLYGLDTGVLAEGGGIIRNGFKLGRELFNGRGVVRVSAGHSYSLFLTHTGHVYSCGFGENGQLGLGSAVSRQSHPQLVEGATVGMQHVIDVCCGQAHSLALTRSGQLYVWGAQQGVLIHHRELQLVEALDQHTPRLVEVFKHYRVLRMAAGCYHSAAIVVDSVNDSSTNQVDQLSHGGKLYTWGWNMDGQLGHGTVEDECFIPKPVVFVAESTPRITQVTLGAIHSMALTDTGRVYSWGSSSKGQAGHGDRATRITASPITTLEAHRCIQISAGGFHGMAMSMDRQVYVWGWAKYGALGIGVATGYAAKPRRLDYFQKNELIPLVIVGGSSHSAALCLDGTSNKLETRI